MVGFTESREHLKEAGLLFAGTSDDAATSLAAGDHQANGIKVGWLGMTRGLNETGIRTRTINRM